MNFIRKLQNQVAEKENTIQETNRALSDFISFLNSPKFTGVEPDGSRKDWIATGDVIQTLREIRSNLS